MDTDSTTTKIVSLATLPDEVLQHILSFISPTEALDRFQFVSRHIHELCSEPLLWRHHCESTFRYWDSKHQIRAKYSSQAGNVGWKDLYIYRRNVDNTVSELLEDILDSQRNRLSRMGDIARYGYDAKDTLLRHYKVADDAEDVLSRRYFAMSILDHIQRSKALTEWQAMLKGKVVPLERALGAFDMFVLHENRGDFHEIADILDDLEKQFQAQHTEFDGLTIRQKALAVVTFLRSRNLVGISNEAEYRDMQNNFVGIALQDPKHPSLPLISCVIFCSLMTRLDLDAHCCGMPGHVYAMVSAPPGQTLDRQPSQPGSTRHIMYLDPFTHNDEVPTDALRRILDEWGVHRVDQDDILLNPQTTSSVVQRTAKNILSTITAVRTTVGITNQMPSLELRPGGSNNDIEHSFYAALWASFMLITPDPWHQRQRRQFIPLLIDKFQSHFPADISLIEKYICPIFETDPRDERSFAEVIRAVKAADQTAKQVHRRTGVGVKGGCKYRVGQVFRHRRYNYTGVIIGWDPECSMDSDWIAHNRVDSLPGGRHQGFYHALTSTLEETSIRYVAEENIKIITPEVPRVLMSTAGRYFKRWDQETKEFVSNVRDEYPED